MAVDQQLYSICTLGHCSAPFLRVTRELVFYLVSTHGLSACDSFSRFKWSRTYLMCTFIHANIRRSLTFFDSFGPVAQYHENSKYYSAVKPAPNKAVDAQLPHITVELPVYKESLSQTM